MQGVNYCEVCTTCLLLNLGKDNIYFTVYGCSCELNNETNSGSCRHEGTASTKYHSMATNGDNSRRENETAILSYPVVGNRANCRYTARLSFNGL